jgi:hypothetical protein
MTSVLDELRSSLSDDHVNEISKRIGADPRQTRHAIDGALPLLLGALGREASDPQRAAGLRKAIEEDHDGSVVENMGSYLSGGVAGRSTNGAGILQHVLGDRQQAAVQGLSARSGLDMSSVASLLPLLAPVVMGMIGKQQRGGGLSLDNLTNVLGGDTKRAANDAPDLGDLLGSVLGGGSGQGSTGGIGDVLGSIFGKR